MKKAYWLAPLVALILFVFLYLQSRVEFDAKIQREKEAKRLEVAAKNAEAKRQTDLAIIERKRITDEKNAKDEADKALKAAELKHLEEISDTREFARRETARYLNVVKDLTESFNTEKVAQEAAKKSIEEMRAEKKFIVDYVAKAQANEKALKELLVKLEKLEKDRVEAAKLAAKNS